MLLLALGLLGSVVTGCSSGTDQDPAGAATSSHGSGGYHGRAIDRPYGLPTQRLTDTAGRPFVPAEDAEAPVTLVFFGYSHCPDICNVVLANVAAALRRADPAVRDRVQLVFVTTDPRRDTAAVMREYLDRFDPSFVGLRGDLATTEATARSIYISYEGTSPKAGGGYDVSHGTQLTAFRDGDAAVVWPAETPVSQLRADLTRLAASA